MSKRWILAITGASGAPLGLRVLEVMLAHKDIDLTLIVSDAAMQTLEIESGWHLGRNWTEMETQIRSRFIVHGSLRVCDAHDIGASAASGSHPVEGMLVVPCSMSTLAAISSGVTMNLIHRAASVMLKEKRSLILVPRESPLSPIHLENMLRLSRIGVHIAPATTAFYTQPQSVADMIDFVAARVLDLAKVPHTLSTRWEGQKQHATDSRIQRYLG